MMCGPSTPPTCEPKHLICLGFFIFGRASSYPGTYRMTRLAMVNATSVALLQRIFLRLGTEANAK